MKIKQHYDHVGPQLSLRGLTPPAIRIEPDEPVRPNAPRVVVPISGIHRGTVKALQFACSITNRITGLYIEIDPALTKEFLQEWERWCPGVPLEVVESPYRSVLIPLLAFLDITDHFHDDGQSAILVLPEIIPAKAWENVLHNQSAWLIKLAVLYRRRKHRHDRVIIDVPFYLDD
jgi:hypothetical protein